MNASSNFRLGFAQRFSQELKSSGGVSEDPKRNATPLEWSNRGRNDMSTFTFTLTLLLLATIVAAQTDNPMFWLLIGPAPFAVLFAGLAFFRHGVIQDLCRNRCVRGCLKIIIGNTSSLPVAARKPHFEARPASREPVSTGKREPTEQALP